MPGLARCFQAKIGLIQQRSELFDLEVVDPHVAGRDGIDPSMEIYLLLPQKKGDGRMGAKMVELGSDVFLCRLD